MTLDNRYAISPTEAKQFDTKKLREEFLIQSLMVPGQIKGTYSHYDRMIVLGVVPTAYGIELPAYTDFTKQDTFLSRRELGLINTGGAGTVEVDDKSWDVANKDCLYIGMGAKKVVFKSVDKDKPAKFFICSAPAHAQYPTAKASKSEANPVHLGAPETCNQRTIYQYIHLKGIKSCQLVLGFTELKSGSIWNTFPPHVHDRRMEVYFYFDLPENQRVCHLMGQPEETR
ncbi:MAG: 5-dehydro-4-deoxy-D-glucuronate isomerase, partial [Cyclobacteriaceae bacterium]